MAVRSLSLWDKVRSVTQKAKSVGGIFTIDTDQEIIKDHGVEFIISISKALNKKPAGDISQKKPDAKTFNPFLPCDPDLLVQEICGTHNLVLNKFNVVDYHLILATVDFQLQSEPLNVKDLTALWVTVSSMNCLGFYNCGPLSGASQPHKHLQLVPLPLEPRHTQYDCPVENLIYQSPPNPTSSLTVAGFNFKHASLLLDQSKLQSGDDSKSGQYVESVYNNLLSTLHKDNDLHGDFSYNFLMTKKWMLIVPRREEKCGNIAINSLGFCGAVLVRSLEDLQTLKDVGPMHVLEHIAFAK